MDKQISLPENSRQREVIRKAISSLSVEESNQLSVWVSELIAVRKSNISKTDKAKEALKITKNSGIGKSTLKVSLDAAKRGGRASKTLWNNRSVPAKIGIGAAATTVAVFGTQGAGIAALGTAIGLPLWMVTGAGAMFATTLYEELKGKQKSDEIVYFVPEKDD